MKQIFISHCAKDRSDVYKFLQLLTSGMGVPQSSIFCTSVSGTLPAGESFSDNIRSALKESDIIICFITPSFLISKYCLSELGAAWIENKKVIPLIIPPVQHTELDNTPFQGLHTLRPTAEDLTSLYDTLRSYGLTHCEKMSVFSQQLDIYLNDSR